jgi:hypothetical protein
MAPAIITTTNTVRLAAARAVARSTATAAAGKSVRRARPPNTRGRNLRHILNQHRHRAVPPSRSWFGPLRPRATADTRSSINCGVGVTDVTPISWSVAWASPYMLQQSLRCSLDEIQHFLEPIRAPVVRIRYLRDVAIRRKFQEQANPIACRGRCHLL